MPLPCSISRSYDSRGGLVLRIMIRDLHRSAAAQLLERLDLVDTQLEAGRLEGARAERDGDRGVGEDPALGVGVAELWRPEAAIGTSATVKREGAALRS